MSDVCLSIDWDYFTPKAIDIWEDNCINEELFNLWDMWKNERWLLKSKEMGTSGVEGFWSWLERWFVISRGRRAVVSESHQAMHDLLEGRHKTLILFDSHHDCYYLSSYNEDSGNTDCGNWGTYWLRRRNRSGRVVWVSQLRDADRETYLGRAEYDVRKGVHAYAPKKAERIFDAMCKKAGGRIRLDFVHICRSGSWAPPWTDAAFLKFLKDSKLDCEVIRKPPWRGASVKDWDPTLDRWRVAKMQQLYNSLQRENCEAEDDTIQERRDP